jgi:RimJ/RimL family protein N-acetyltransferase
MLITRNDFGLAALINENSGPIIGVARYAYDPAGEMPELAVAVRDDWQGNGLGSILFIRVIKVGREHGYLRFGALVDPQNRTMMNIFKRLGCDYKISCMEQGAYFIEMQA